MEAPILVEVTRGPAVECRHRGEIAVVNVKGEVQRHLGDVDTPVCLRSLAKPFQALPLLATGAAQAFGFGDRELALCSGSLSGQEFHVDLVKDILKRLKLTPEALQCGAHAPLHRPTAKALAQTGEKPQAVHHTCAGKHAGMLALCLHHGWPVENYMEPDHPVQRLMLTTVAQLVGLPPKQIVVATDGCGVPTFYVPLRHIALGFARLAGAQEGSPAAKLLDAALTHPRLIAGDGRLETTLMEVLAGRVFAKTGAEGGFALAVREGGGLGLAVKIEDGGSRALGPAIIHLLKELNFLSPEAEKALAALGQPAILNQRKQQIGGLRPAFSLVEG